jgi:hypothetical protein
MTEQQKAEARDRRRSTEPRKSALAELTVLNPAAYLDARQLEYVKEMEDIASAAKAAGNLALAEQTYRDLLRLTPLGRARLDVTAHLDKQDVPDLSMLPPEQLLEIIRRSQTLTEPITIEIPERAAGNGHADGIEERPPS